MLQAPMLASTVSRVMLTRELLYGEAIRGFTVSQYSGLALEGALSMATEYIVQIDEWFCVESSRYPALCISAAFTYNTFE